eukprot:jgi/Botrbrau1/19728/Bobra.0604s0001.1
MQKPQINSSHNTSSSPTSPRSCIAQESLCNIIDSDNFSPTFASAKVMCPMLEPVHFKSAPHDSTGCAMPSLGWTHKCCSVLPRVFGIPTRRVEISRKGIVLPALKRFKVAYITTGRMLKNANSLRRKTMHDKKLALGDFSQSSNMLACRSLDLEGIRKQGAAARAIQPCATTLMDQGSPINNGDAANAVHTESPPQRAATDNDTYKVPCSKGEVQEVIPGSMTKDQVCRMPPSQLGSFCYHGYLNGKYATRQRIRASI